MYFLSPLTLYFVSNFFISYFQSFFHCCVKNEHKLLIKKIENKIENKKIQFKHQFIVF